MTMIQAGCITCLFYVLFGVSYIKNEFTYMAECTGQIILEAGRRAGNV